ncbi:hypothetical protein ABT232_16470 [Streptomyces sp. NPDC001532]|uniref:hypothetical protein n=1 Tax=Streptomyces sp. NPDC001532 TaxID=3154520 RepID=UPI0033242086
MRENTGTPHAPGATHTTDAPGTAASGGALSSAGRRTFGRVPGPLLALGALLTCVQIILMIVTLGGSPDDGKPGGAAGPSDDGKVEITYIVTGDRPSADISYTTPEGSENHDATVLPFRMSFDFERDASLSLQAQNRHQHGAGKVMCTILADGVVVKQSKASGEYASAQCSGTAGADEPLPGVPVPSLTPGAAPLPDEVRLTDVVDVERYPGKGSPVLGRVSDPDARLSYAELGGKWNRSRATDPLLDGFNRKQSFDTEATWEATVRSGLVDGDLMEQATGSEPLRKLAAAVQDERQEYSFVDGETHGRDIASQPLTVDGHKAWVLIREMHFRKYGVKANMDLSTVVVVDTGRPRASVLWIDLPETENDLRPDINTLIDSLRVG